MKKCYASPLVEMVEVSIEMGFATSDSMENPDIDDGNQDMPWS